ncbi:hypothetical protein BJ875DRAFT_471840 [Amylocarpus encephaloides]|uniref:Heterokaryon incompatibility domain-containing protein n=1 Tax=Amylocarpus encephaloides TaxID=45428 RepID=A0A9P7YCH8_9HELO|nr:hypothetical protein BJ875DRAFT_471840 [Amylocarpus encephaloides]
MWLLDARTFLLCPFADDKIPPYGILSHTWVLPPLFEVSFQELQQLKAKKAQTRAGIVNNDSRYAKIKGCCAKAQSENPKIHYVWIDTCCIDKTSSAELSESIGSMFRWYQAAMKCYAYMEDVAPGDDVVVALGNSRWFTRGWTLQELIAPKDLRFFNKLWNEIGSKETLSNDIEHITRIPSAVLRLGSLAKYSVAQKMSWAAQRKCTRSEDRAYSLLGLFGVSMPMLYGEGEKAFLRLQLEIMKLSTDHSLFAWKGPGDFRGPLAGSPLEFEECQDINAGPLAYGTAESTYEMTNVGLRITLLVSKTTLKDEQFVKYAFLNCKVKGERAVGIWIQEIIVQGQPTGLFVRHFPEIFDLQAGDESDMKDSWVSQKLYLVQPDFHLFDVAEAFHEMKMGANPPSDSAAARHEPVYNKALTQGRLNFNIAELLRAIPWTRGYGISIVNLCNDVRSSNQPIYDKRTRKATVDALEGILDALQQAYKAIYFSNSPSLQEDPNGKDEHKRISSGALVSFTGLVDSCLTVFYQIQSLLTGESTGEVMERKFDRKLFQFHEEVKKNQKMTAFLVPKRSIFDVNRKIKVGSSLQSLSRIDEYNMELHRLQSDLIRWTHMLDMSYPMRPVIISDATHPNGPPRETFEELRDSANSSIERP